MKTLLLLLPLVLLACEGAVEEPSAIPPGEDSGTQPDSAIDSATTDSAMASAEDSATTTMETEPPIVEGDLGAAKAMVQKLGLGVNIERAWAWELPGQSATTTTKYWDYLKKTAAVTHVRLFYPWRPTVAMGGGGAGNSPPDEGQFARILDASDQAIKAGLVVFLDCTDVMGIEDFTGDAGKATARHLDNCAAWTAKRAFDPKMIAIGPVNEWAGGDDNVLYNKLRKDYHAVLRAKLPGYVLTTGPAYWKSRDFIYDPSKKFEVFDDLRVIYEWHHYSSLDADGWRKEEEKLAAWRASHGDRPTVCGEAGAGYWDEPVAGGKLSQRPASWPPKFAAMLGNIAAERPMLWAITYGGDYRVNKAGDNPQIMDGTGGDPDMLKVFKDGAAAIAAASK